MNNILYLFNPWWEGKKFFTGIAREKYLAEIKKNLDNKQALLVVGSRRVGKTVLIHQAIQFLLDRKEKPEKIVYLPLDHPSLQGRKILDLLREVRELHGLAMFEKIFLFLDEVQFLPDWEQEVKALVDFEKVKIFVSGSATTKILSRGTFLTGRTLTFVIKPFDFREFLQFQNKVIEKTDQALKNSLLKKFLQVGGYPEYVQTQNPLYFSDLITNVINKDIANLFPVKNPGLVLQLLNLLADRVGTQTSLTKLGAVLDLTKDTVKDYIYYLSSTFLVSELGKYSSSRNATVYSPKKFYLLDAGLLFNLSGKLNLGTATENLVFQKFAGLPKTGFYFENQKEIDFLANGQAYEVKYELSDLGWEKLAGQIKKLPAGKFEKITVLTTTLRKKETVNGIKIDFVSLADFLS
jgi:predicted AAA+ superfamily ATPase